MLVVPFTMIGPIGTTKLASTYEMKALQRIIGGKLGKAIHLLHYDEVFSEEKSLCKQKEHLDEIFGWSPLGVINANTTFA